MRDRETRVPFAMQVPFGLVCEMIHNVVAAVQTRVPFAMPFGLVFEMIHNVVAAVQSAAGDQTKGVWIGRRGLSRNPFGVAVLPGADGFHYALMMNGHIYQIGAGGGNMSHVEASTDHVWHDEVGRDFEWVRMNEAGDFGVRRSHEQIALRAGDIASGMRYHVAV
eukprot:Hpha_TRINITY_DN5633_c0_g1::TRINITY_DN5633_c0_g1_i1::g.50614::m.50614